MSTFSSSDWKSVIFNGNTVNKIILNGTTVWTSSWTATVTYPYGVNSIQYSTDKSSWTTVSVTSCTTSSTGSTTISGISGSSTLYVRASGVISGYTVNSTIVSCNSSSTSCTIPTQTISATSIVGYTWYFNSTVTNNTGLSVSQSTIMTASVYGFRNGTIWTIQGKNIACWNSSWSGGQICSGGSWSNNYYRRWTVSAINNSNYASLLLSYFKENAHII